MQIEIKKKKITFKNPITHEIVTEIEMPQFIRLTPTEVCDLSGLGSHIKMLYIDVLCRGYHPVKGLEPEAKNIFKTSCIDNLNECKLIKISNNEAIGTIWRCLAREIGRPLKDYNIEPVKEELFQLMEKLKAKSDFTTFEKAYLKGSTFENRYEECSKEISEKEKEIKELFDKFSEKYFKSEEQHKKTNKRIADKIEKHILDLEHRIFLKTLIGIRQYQENTELVEFVLEQPYPYIWMSYKKAVEMLGIEIFKEKWQYYQQHAEKFSLESEVLLVCHRCLIPLNGEKKIVGCNDICSNLNVETHLLTNPYMYNRQVINENCWDQDTRKYIHPYLIYYSLDSERKAVCSRYYCNKCERLELGLSTSGCCSYCEGVCDCVRCQGMDLMTKMMAVFIDYGGNLVKTFEEFWMKFDLGKLDPKHKKVVKDREEKEAEMNFYLYNLYEKKIFLQRKDLPLNNFEYEKVFFFPSRVDKEEKETYHKYRLEKKRQTESILEKKNKKLKQLRQKEEINKLNELISRKNDEAEISDEFEESKRVSFNLKQKETGTSLSVNSNQTIKTKPNEPNKKETFEEILRKEIIFSDDSDS